MGLFDKPGDTADGKLRELLDVPIFITNIEARDVDTMYGPGTALDVYIQVDSDGGTRMYSGFAAGILRQVRDAEEGDFPTWATIREKPLREGKSTLVLEKAEEQEFTDPEEIPF